MSLPVSADPLPPSYQFGKIVGRLIHAIADTDEDTDDKPQARPSAGKVRFTPKETLRKVTDAGNTAIVTQGPETANLSASGRILDAEGRQGIWLVEGIWTVSFELTNVGSVRPTVPAFDIEVLPEYDDATPLDLATVMPYTAPTGTVVQTVAIPAGGTTGQVLIRTADGGLVWADQTAEIDLTGYVTDQELTDAIAAIPDPDLSGYATTDALTTGLAGKQDTGSYIVEGDARLTDARTPLAHTQAASTISDSTPTGRAVLTAASQAAARTAIGAGTSDLTIGTTGTTAAAGNDTRLSDQRVPTDLSVTSGKLATGAVTNAKLGDGSVTDAKVAAANKDGAAGTPSLRTLGTGSNQAAAGNDTRLSDARTPTVHTHPVGDLDTTGTPSTDTYLRGDGSWETPPSADVSSALEAYHVERRRTWNGTAWSARAAGIPAGHVIAYSNGHYGSTRDPAVTDGPADGLDGDGWYGVDA